MTDNKQKDTNLFRLGAAFFALAVAMILGQFLGGIIVGLMDPSMIENPLVQWGFSLGPIYLIGLPICLLILRKSTPVPPEKTKMRVSGFLLSLVVSFGAMFAGNLIGNGIMMIISGLKGETVSNPIQDILISSDLWISLLPTVILAPIGEEFIFRRLIIDRTRRYGELPAILLSGTMFAAFHMNLYQVFYTFLIGCVLGYVYVKTGRLRYCVALHAIVNFMGGIYPMIMLQGMQPFLSDIESLSTVQILLGALSVIGILLLYVVYIGCLIAAIVLACLHLRRISLLPGEGGQQIWHSPFLILFFAVCIAMTVFAICV